MGKFITNLVYENLIALITNLAGEGGRGNGMCVKCLGMCWGMIKGDSRLD